ncbi:MAG: class I SAM-dependent methyltransferase [Geminicoccaceae bacterium]
MLRRSGWIGMVEGRTDMRHGATVAKPFGENQPASETVTAASKDPPHHRPADPEGTQAVYEAHAAAWDRQRHKGLIERPWLDRLLALAGPDAAILDLGCGAGEPIARYLVAQGCRVTGVDFAAAMLAIARTRLPAARWLQGDMRELDLAERFAGIVAWDSFFHLTRDEQRAVIPRLARHLAPGGALLVTVGPEDSEVTGTVDGAAVHHASLSPKEYARLLARAGLELVDFVAEDPACDHHSVLLAQRI